MPKHKVIIRRARVGRVGLTPEMMARVGDVFNKSVKARLLRAQDVNDQAAPALDARYAKNKAASRYHANPVRDLKFSGRTHQAMVVLVAGFNTTTIGLRDAVANFRVKINNRKVRQYGSSPKNLRDAIAAANAELKGGAVEILAQNVA